jgi:hypothetical protein
VKHKIGEVIEFGEKLINTQDLDPVYVALVNAKLPTKQLHRLLLAYFCFYHLGVSAFISEMEGGTFWEVMMVAARNKLCGPDEINPDLEYDRWPRGSERRHFRGQKCVDAVRTFRSMAPNPEDIVGSFAFNDYELREITAYIQKHWPMCGSWLSFKAADIFERVLGIPIEFPNDTLTFYKEPRAALDLLNLSPEAAANKLLLHFRNKPAPPASSPRARSCNIQEIESMACKWKSSLSGHYWVGKDIHEVRHGLKGWGETASLLSKYMPPEVERGLFA